MRDRYVAGGIAAILAITYLGLGGIGPLGPVTDAANQATGFALVCLLIGTAVFTLTEARKVLFVIASIGAIVAIVANWPDVDTIRQMGIIAMIAGLAGFITSFLPE